MKERVVKQRVVRPAIKRTAFPVEQIGMFLSLLDNVDNKRLGLGMRLLIITGGRAGELLKAEWSDIREDEWRAPTSKTKMRHTVINPLSDWALETLDEL